MSFLLLFGDKCVIATQCYQNKHISEIKSLSLDELLRNKKRRDLQVVLLKE
jgi:hypothetical protein